MHIVSIARGEILYNQSGFKPDREAIYPYTEKSIIIRERVKREYLQKLRNFRRREPRICLKPKQAKVYWYDIVAAKKSEMLSWRLIPKINNAANPVGERGSCILKMRLLLRREKWTPPQNLKISPSIRKAVWLNLIGRGSSDWSSGYCVMNIAAAGAPVSIIIKISYFLLLTEVLWQRPAA